MTAITSPADAHKEALFPRLGSADLACLTEYGQEVRLQPGEAAFVEGGPAESLYVVLEGVIRVTKKVGKEEVVLAIHEAGEFTGELSLLAHNAKCIASGYAVSPCRLLRVSSQALRRVFTGCPSITDTIVSAMARRVQEAELIIQQREKLAALGSMAAGLAHELNNPAAAGRSAALQLAQTLASLHPLAVKLFRGGLSDEQVATIESLRQEAAGPAAPIGLDPLERSDREEVVAQWLEGHGLKDGWKLAPSFVNVGFETHRLDDLARRFPGTLVADLLLWFEGLLSASGLLQQTVQCAERISQLVMSVKKYSYMDKAPLQEVDLHEGIESTLTMLGYKLKQGTQVVKHFEAGLPKVCAYGAELNQVWTNLIDNAIYAAGSKGRIEISTKRENDHVLVEIADNGPGIPPEVKSKLFAPFFTTKPVGEGTGLGLSIAYRLVTVRHGGEIGVRSEPGNTCFQVRLPLRKSSESCNAPSAAPK